MRKNSWVLLFILILFFSFTSNASAVTIESLAGSKAVSAMLSLQTVSQSDMDDVTMAMLIGSLGYFFSDNFELNGSIMRIVAESSGMETTMTDVSAVFNYNIILGSTFYVPYAGLNLGMAIQDVAGESETDVSYGGQGGVKCFLSEDLSLNTELRLTQTADQTTVQLFVGFSFYFGK